MFNLEKYRWPVNEKEEKAIIYILYFHLYLKDVLNVYSIVGYSVELNIEKSDF